MQRSSMGAACQTASLVLGGLLSGRVHVVDDDASFRTAIARRLQKAGYEVVTYPSAQHFLDRMPSESELGCAARQSR